MTSAHLITSLLSLLMMTVVLVGGWATHYDQQFQYSCHNNQFLNSFRSQHHNHFEDRVWDFGCANLPQPATLEHCSWSDYVNNFDDPVSYICPGNKVMVGINSFHNNHFDDRRFKFLCCSPSNKVVHNCQITGNANSFDGLMNYSVPLGKVLAGMVSFHSNHYEDRVFRFVICNITNAC